MQRTPNGIRKAGVCNPEKPEREHLHARKLLTAKNISYDSNSKSDGNIPPFCSRMKINSN